MIASRIAAYEKGAITGNHLVVQCLHLLDPADPSVVLERLPPEIIQKVLAFVREYRPNGMVTNYGVLPTVDQVEAAKKWIEAHSQMGTPA